MFQHNRARRCAWIALVLLMNGEYRYSMDAGSCTSCCLANFVNRHGDRLPLTARLTVHRRLAPVWIHATHTSVANGVSPKVIRLVCAANVGYIGLA